MAVVDALHNLFRGDDGVFDRALEHRRRPAVPIRQLASRKDARGNQDDALATFVHERSLASSL